jgi:hypothetical protein
MKMSEYLKKKRYLLILTFVVITGIIVSSIYTFTKGSKESNNIQEQDLKVTYNIAKNILYPMDRVDGANKADSSSIHIRNTSNKNIKYKLIFDEDNSTLDKSKIYININNNTYILSDFNDNTILHDSIKPNDEYTITFKSWVGLDLITSSDNDKVLNIKYQIIEE